MVGISKKKSWFNEITPIAILVYCIEHLNNHDFQKYLDFIFYYR